MLLGWILPSVFSRNLSQAYWRDLTLDGLLANYCLQQVYGLWIIWANTLACCCRTIALYLVQIRCRPLFSALFFSRQQTHQCTRNYTCSTKEDLPIHIHDYTFLSKVEPSTIAPYSPGPCLDSLIWWPCLGILAWLVLLGSMFKLAFNSHQAPILGLFSLLRKPFHFDFDVVKFVLKVII